MFRKVVSTPPEISMLVRKDLHWLAISRIFASFTEGSASANFNLFKCLQNKASKLSWSVKALEAAFVKGQREDTAAE